MLGRHKGKSRPGYLKVWMFDPNTDEVKLMEKKLSLDWDPNWLTLKLKNKAAAEAEKQRFVESAEYKECAVGRRPHYGPGTLALLHRNTWYDARLFTARQLEDIRKTKTMDTHVDNLRAAWAAAAREQAQGPKESEESEQDEASEEEEEASESEEKQSDEERHEERQEEGEEEQKENPREDECAHDACALTLPGFRVHFDKVLKAAFPRPYSNILVFQGDFRAVGRSRPEGVFEMLAKFGFRLKHAASLLSTRMSDFTKGPKAILYATSIVRGASVPQILRDALYLLVQRWPTEQAQDDRWKSANAGKMWESFLREWLDANGSALNAPYYNHALFKGLPANIAVFCEAYHREGARYIYNFIGPLLTGDALDTPYYEHGLLRTFYEQCFHKLCYCALENGITTVVCDGFGLREKKFQEAARICYKALLEVVAAFRPVVSLTLFFTFRNDDESKIMKELWRIDEYPVTFTQALEHPPSPPDSTMFVNVWNNSFLVGQSEDPVDKVIGTTTTAFVSAHPLLGQQFQWRVIV